MAKGKCANCGVADVAGRSYCSPCQRAYDAGRTERARHNRLILRYGISLDDYERLFLEQNGVCAICGRPPSLYSLAVDHDHNTGIVRGLLCIPCNRQLGWWDNYSQEILAYLAKQRD